MGEKNKAIKILVTALTLRQVRAPDTQACRAHRTGNIGHWTQGEADRIRACGFQGLEAKGTGGVLPRCVGIQLG